MRNDRERDGGWLLVEVMIGVTVLALGILGFMFSFQSNFRATRDIETRDLVQAALVSTTEKLRAADFSTLYATYQNSSFPAPDVYAPSGAAAQVLVHFDVNETTLPAEYGPVLDIDGDGAKTTIDASAHYVLLPTRLSLTYQAAWGAETKVVYLVLGP